MRCGVAGLVAAVLRFDINARRFVGIGEFELVDLRSEGFFQRYTETMNMLASNDIDFIRIIQEPRFEAEYVEVVVEALPLKMELKEFTLRVILLSLFISTFVGVLIYLSLVFLVVRPIRKITGAIESIRDAPRDFIDDIQPTGRSDEIGRAEDSLHDMQTTVRAALRERDQPGSACQGERGREKVEEDRPDGPDRADLQMARR